MRDDRRVVINNDGYAIERALHGSQQRYNDIPRWNWALLPAAMGGEAVRTAHARTPGEFTVALDRFADPADLVLIEMILPKMDVPEVLSALHVPPGDSVCCDRWRLRPDGGASAWRPL
jgi:indolepyruvate decarboxylase